MKATFWGFLALVALPSFVPADFAGESTPPANPNPVEASLHAMHVAGGVSADMGAFCERQPTVCDSGRMLGEAAISRARQGLVIAGGWIGFGEEETPPSES